MSPTKSFADLVIRNAKIYTMDPALPWASALAVQNGRFSEIGDESRVTSLVGPETRVVDAKGGLILPGLMDSHTHAFEGARADLFEIRIPATSTLEEIIEAVRPAAARVPSGRWLKGAGWHVRNLIAQISTKPSLAMLDEATGDCPTMLRDSSHHTAFANSAAMRLAGVTPQTPNPEDGWIVKDADGDLTGIFLEKACALLEKAIPAASESENQTTAQRAIAIFNSFGLTGFVHAATSETTMRAFKRLDDAGKLSAWIATCISTDSLLTPERDGIGEVAIANRGKYRSAHIAVDFVKYFMDGVPGTRTAAFIEPYLSSDGSPPSHPLPFHSVKQLRDHIAPLDKQGIHVKIHAVGDQAIRYTLDAIEEVRRINGRPGPQHSIAHLGYITESDIPRLAELNILADFCPPLWFPNPSMKGNAAVLGPERGGRSQATGDVLKSGAAVAFGTDWPIIPTPNPWTGLSGLITRKDPTGKIPGIYRPEQAITLEQALPLCTINVAKSMGFGEHAGSITKGKSADFILPDRNLFEIAPEDIAGTKVLQTYFAGQLVHDAASS
jgi:predicted amidohydrolase YtcJ